MPVIVPAPRGAPLTQGDILGNVTFALANFAGDVTTDSGALYTLVVSRPCVSLRDSSVVVAPIRAFNLDLGKVDADDKKPLAESLDRMRRLLSGVRDGGKLTDSFYLGTLDPSQGNQRFAADLSALSTQMLPTSPEQRQQWVDERRIGTLDMEFVRDLHVRLFNTFARLGFDDHRWFSDADLAVLITSGRQEISALEKESLDATRAVERLEAEGKPIPAKAADQVRTKEAKLNAAREALRPYVEEQTRRQA